jgi:stage II sporulation protein D
MIFPKLAASALAAAAVVGAATAGTDPRPAPSPGVAVFTVSGRGWGHGVGMSQWGAYGMARRGSAFAAILSHYYRGTTLGRAPVARVRVLLAEGRKTVSIGSTAPFTVRDALGDSYELTARRVQFGPGLRINVDGTAPRPLAGPLVFSPTSAPLEVGGKRYRGTFEVTVSQARVRVVNGVRLEQYLWGVVPDEMPDEWPAEALKAQAVVARSYALAVRRRTGPFDLYADVRSQVYGGIASEEAPATAAVNATAGQVLLHAGKVATTFFFSTSGGKTANVEDVWLGSKPTPYLVSVPDPHDSASPHHRWGPIAVPAARMTQVVGAGGTLLDVRTTRNRSGRAAQVFGVTAQAEIGVTASALREKLGLRSTWFTLGMLRLDRPARAAAYGSRMRLTGLARGLAGVALEERRPGGAWKRLAAAPRVAAGALTADLRALAPIELRLASGTVRTPAVRLAVAPAVRLAAAGSGALRGTVRPATAGATVRIERRTAAGAWREVARAPVAESGIFEASLAVTPGTYRARVTLAGGFAPGLSPALVVAAP